MAKRRETYERDEGQWRAGRQISGSQVWRGGQYDGQFADSLPNGRGVLIFGDARYEGLFLNGKPNGKATLTNASGSFYGNWADGCFNDGKHRAAIGVSLDPPVVFADRRVPSGSEFQVMRAFFAVPYRQRLYGRY